MQKNMKCFAFNFNHYQDVIKKIKTKGIKYCCNHSLISELLSNPKICSSAFTIYKIVFNRFPTLKRRIMLTYWKFGTSETSCILSYCYKVPVNASIANIAMLA